MKSANLLEDSSDVCVCVCLCVFIRYLDSTVTVPLSTSCWSL